MADQEQVDRLEQGVDVWNDWRDKNSGESIDLSGANLRGADLSSTNLRGAKLSSTDFRGADLSSTDLRGAKLRGAKLSYADFRGADLSRAFLSRAFLVNANFSSADLSGAKLSGAKLSGAYLIGADLSGAKLSGAKLSSAYLNGDKLSSADLSYADLRDADLSGADLKDAKLIRAKLIGADLSSTNLTEANIESANLDYAIVDGETLIVRCKINDSTYAHGVGLDSARIQESLKTKLKKNIRKKYWVERYPHYFDRRSIPRYIRSVPRYLRLLSTTQRWSSIHKVLWSCVVREFWKASDYGSSTKQILKTFGCWSLFFSFAYLMTAPAPDGAFWPTPLGNPFLDNFGTAKIFEQNICNNFPGSFFCYFQLWFRSLYFSVVTMTTLGFGDIHAHPLSVPGQALVMFQVLIGYILLGVLITRLSILFQDVG